MVSRASMLAGRSPALQKVADKVSTFLKSWLNKSLFMGGFLYLMPYANYLIETDACNVPVRLVLLHAVFISYI